MATKVDTRTLVIPDLKPIQRTEAPRRHVLNRMMQEKSGRLYCSDDYDFDIPDFTIYAAR